MEKKDTRTIEYIEELVGINKTRGKNLLLKSPKERKMLAYQKLVTEEEHDMFQRMCCASGMQSDF